MIGLARTCVVIALMVQAASCAPEPAREKKISPWPLTMPWALISCENSAVFLQTPEGDRYAVNGTARSQAPLMDAVQTRYDHDLIGEGLALCKENAPPLKIVPGPEATPPPIGEPEWSLTEGGVRSDRISIVAKSEDVIQGVRPELHIECDGDGGIAWIDMNRMPPRASPLREVAKYKTGRVSNWTVISVSGVDGEWFLRNDKPEEKRAQKKFISDVLWSDLLVFSAPPGFNHDGEFSWRSDRLGDGISQARRTCAPTAR